MKGSMFMKAAGIVAAVAFMSVGCQKAEEPKPAVVEEAPTTPPPAPVVDSAAIKDSIRVADSLKMAAAATKAVKKATPKKSNDVEVKVTTEPKADGAPTTIQIRKSR